MESSVCSERADLPQKQFELMVNPQLYMYWPWNKSGLDNPSSDCIAQVGVEIEIKA
jgi:hypothetical protein